MRWEADREGRAIVWLAVHLHGSAMVLYGNALFSARFSMTENGMIEMIDDEPVAADLPVKKIKPNY